MGGNYFAEGATYVEDTEKIYQLTYKSDEVFIYDVNQIESGSDNVHEATLNEVVTVVSADDDLTV